ncbi:MAG TPA: HAMP domain-containing sensor histidine kinase [Candidatus Limiplasma sp.]|nr:HAMP domain-containing sensor histidine kinase [Candidatus Limiplasma sp.]
MIRKLRKKLIIVLMIILSLLLVGILVSMLLSTRMNYERRSINAFNDVPSSSNSFDRTVMMAMPVASITLDTSGNYSVTQNQIHYVSDEELIQIASSIAETDDEQSLGIVSSYNLRYRRYEEPDGTVVFSFSDTYIERDSLNSQIFFSIIIGIGALALFFIVSLLLSRWMVKPVERSWEKQRQFVADASHELKTPLTVILSNTEMLIDSNAVTDEKNRMRLDNIRAESKRMKALTEALLNLARTDSKPKSTAKENVNLSFILSSAALMLEPTIFDLGRTIESEIEENVTIHGDQDKLRQLADILIDNAVQYGAEKSPIVVRLKKQNKKEALMSVISEGIPLSAEDCTNIFERFYRVDASRGQIKGFGLGLSIARSIAEEHGGKIWAVSDGKSKNTFFVKLPIIGSPV